jgi:hypothetical protein
MKSLFLSLCRAAAACALVALVANVDPALASQQYQYPDPKPPEKKDKPAVSEAENNALKKVDAAADPTAKLQAAGEFIKKHPKSTKRLDVARVVAGRIATVEDPAQQIALSENFLTVFKEPAEAEVITPLLVDAYVKANRVDDAFRVAAAYLEKHPEDVGMLTQMGIVGAEQLKRQNPKYAQQSQTYSAKAIELIEADKMPQSMDAARWGEYKTRWLPQLYISLGLVSYLSNNKPDAKAKLEKATTLNATDPVGFMLLGTLVNEEYQKLAEQHKTMMAGPAKDETLKRAHEKMDQVIDLYARTVALASGNPQYQPLHDQVRQDLEAYYKYRHNGSTEGMQQLIDKYKKPPASQ